MIEKTFDFHMCEPYNKIYNKVLNYSRYNNVFYFMTVKKVKISSQYLDIFIF